MNNELLLEIKAQVTDANNKVNQLAKSLENVSDVIDKTKSGASKLSTAFNFGSLFLTAKRAGKQFMSLIDTTNDYSESLNLFNVVLGNTDEQMSKIGKSGLRFQNSMAEAFGTQKSQTLTYQGLFQSMAENMGIVEDKAYIMSENTTKLINDLSSLYNKSEKTTAEALRAGIYSGQTKPLRNFGLDVTERSLQPHLDKLNLKDENGIGLAVRDLNQAEKQILRYIAVLNQSKIAHKDWANTIEAPSNQLRIFKNQLVECKVALGALFQGAFAKILPYANAILMVIKEVSKAIASMFGIKIKDYNSGVAGFEDVEDAVVSVGDGADTSKKKIKELKREILSFDQIHNIDENKDNDTGSGGGSSFGGGGINQALLDAIEGYDNGMDKVRMKATEIRDRIMEWLGFTKEIDPLTGDVSFKLKEGWQNLHMIGSIIAGLIGLKLFKRIKNLGTAIFGTKDSLTLLGKTIVGVSNKVGGFKGALSSLSSTLETIGGVSGLAGLSVAIVGWGLVITDAWNNSENFRSSVENLKNSFIEFCSAVMSYVEPLKNVLNELSQNVLTPLSTILWAILSPFIEIINQFLRFELTTVIDGLSTSLRILTSLLKGDFHGALTELGGWLDTLGVNFDEFKGNVEEAFNNSYNVVQEKITEIKEYISKKWEEFCKWADKLPAKAGQIAGNIVGTIVKFFAELPMKIWHELLRTKEKMNQWKNDFIVWCQNEVPKIPDKIATFFQELPNKIKEKLLSKFEQFKNIGKWILDAIVEGMKNIGSALGNFGDNFVSSLKKKLGIHSPSKLVIDAKIGNFTTDGIIVGMENELPKVNKVAKQMVEVLSNTFDDGDFNIGFGTNKNINIKTDFDNQEKPIFDYNSIRMASYYGFAQAIQDYGLVNINIDAKTDKGTIVETAIDGINDIKRRTGDCPIEVI